MRNVSNNTLLLNDNINETPTRLPFCDLLPTDVYLEYNADSRVMTVLSKEEPRILAMQQFTKNEWLLLINLIQYYPHYAPHETLLAQLTMLSYDDWHQQLQKIRRSQPDALVRELKPVYRTLSNIRTKLKKLYPRLKISLVRNLGYVLTLDPEGQSDALQWS